MRCPTQIAEAHGGVGQTLAGVGSGVGAAAAGSSAVDVPFAVAALMEVPEQYLAIRKLGLL
jgi:hypothetical protein